jgi:DNA helicase-2/ATP-dependent DNA helicase PcrA
MNAMDETNAEFGRRCEAAWRVWLRGNRRTVTPLCEATGNSAGTEAPLIEFGIDSSARVRAPDFRTDHGDEREYWEVKGRQSPSTDPNTGLSEHYIDLDQFQDYKRLATRDPGIKFWIVVYEAPTASSEGRWLKISLHRALESGRLVRWIDAHGHEKAQWKWPVREMDLVKDGPAVDSVGVVAPASDRGVSATTDAIEPVRELELLREELGLPHVPRYSVLRVGSIARPHLLQLLHLGIRVYLLTSSAEDESALRNDPSLAAFLDRRSRLLEVSRIANRDRKRDGWVCDGRFGKDSEWIGELLDQSEGSGGINARQFRVIHESRDADICVIAGAGTGKTETLSERIVFLLATSIPTPDRAGQAINYETRLSDIALITFTRDAASEIRDRLARTLTLRRRLCSRLVHPVVPWLMQLGQCNISTIHTFAKRLIQQHGTSIGINPGFRVKQLVRQREAIIDRHLSDLLADHDGTLAPMGRDAPAFYEWRKHVVAVWEGLEENGVSLARDDKSPIDVDWGDGHEDKFWRTTTTIVKDCIQRSAIEFTRLCMDHQVVPTSRLVAVAMDALARSKTSHTAGPKFVFVDEFQDTDPIQMQMLLEVRSRFQCRMYVVGDSKQGIYRFRGAEGDAFRRLDELRKGHGGGAIPRFKNHRLVTNFRSLPKLLEHFDRAFSAWGNSGRKWLGYDRGHDRLTPGVTEPGDAMFKTKSVFFNEWAEKAADQVCEWRKKDRNALIAVLCRRNSQARAVHRCLAERSPEDRGDIELVVGGSFFASRAVAEARAFMQALVHPEDGAALAELLETRWGQAVVGLHSLEGVKGSEAWNRPFPETPSWRNRLGALSATRKVVRVDLDALAARLRSLLSLAHRSTPLGLLVRCKDILDPASRPAASGDPADTQERYRRNLDHLFSRLDEEFEQSPASMAEMLRWVIHQAATNRREDDPALTSRDPERKTLLMTVHAAKGREFDFVLVPNTFTKFVPPQQMRTSEVSVIVGTGSPTRRLIWRWNPRGGRSCQNVAARDPLWNVDATETIREEARLLYVAMTRAKRELVIFKGDRPCRVPADTDLERWRWQAMVDQSPGGTP